jgi:uncharacterized protein YcgL (UPF0745 family)
VPTLLTPGEFVTKREASKRSALLLDAINGGELDDKLFLQLKNNKQVVNVNQDKVVEAIENIPQVDYYMQGSVIFEHRNKAASKRIELRRRIAI